MILNKNDIENAAEFYSMVTGLNYESDKTTFKQGVEWAEKEFKSLLEDIIFLDADEYTDGEVIDLIVSKFNLKTR